jgi:GNAT superfamily N-acetyltransferase
MPPFTIRPTAKFPEPEFSRMQRLVFADVQQDSAALDALLQGEASGAPSAAQHAPMFRLGAYLNEGDELIGWSCGWMERGRVFYVANSGVLAAHRRRGIYSALQNAMRAHAQASGAVALRSQHSVMNNAVIIAKLRAGYHVSGLSQSAQMGSLLELTLHLSDGRETLYRERTLPYVAAVAAAALVA